jgi:hypothetical protein
MHEWARYLIALWRLPADDAEESEPVYPTDEEVEVSGVGEEVQYVHWRTK